MNALTGMVSTLSIETLKEVVMSLRSSYSNAEFLVFESAFNELETRLSDSEFASFAKQVEAGHWIDAGDSRRLLDLLEQAAAIL